MDLSKAFDSVNHDLLPAKLVSYGIDLDALQLLKKFSLQETSESKSE